VLRLPTMPTPMNSLKHGADGVSKRRRRKPLPTTLQFALEQVVRDRNLLRPADKAAMRWRRRCRMVPPVRNPNSEAR